MVATATATATGTPKRSKTGTLRPSHAVCCVPDRGEIVAVPAVEDDALAAMAKALGHPARVRIIRLLAERQACVTGDLVAELPLAQSTISEHLRILREAGLIQGEIEGPRTSYCVNRAALRALQAALSSL